MTKLVRLHKFISDCGYCSRRKAEELVAAGKVRVNGKVISELGSKIDPEKDWVKVKNQSLRPAIKGVAIFHKPRGMLCTLKDPEGRPCLGELLTQNLKSYFPVGRLDWDSTGLVILTNDGDLADRLMHPRYGFERTYEIRVQGRPNDKLLERLGNGVPIDGRPVKASVKVLEDRDDTTWLQITIYEGRNHIIKRLMERLNHPVLKLKRVSHGPFFLGRLQSGEVRRMTEAEYKRLKTKVIEGPRQPAPARPTSTRNTSPRRRPE